MNILVDITHPAHVHFFKNAIWIWQARGHAVCIAARDKDITLDLLCGYHLPHSCLSRVRRGMGGLSIELLEHQAKLYNLIKGFRPDVILEHSGAFIVHVAKMARVPSIVYTDTEHAKLENGITFPFADVICTPTCYKGNLGSKHIRYNSYHELAYLHPNRFASDPRALEEAGVTEDDPFFIVRFVSWEASHDIGQRGFSYDGKRELVRLLERYGRAIITSEYPLPPELDRYRIDVSPTRIHDLLYYAAMYIGESATMASESAVLGTPAILVSPAGCGYTDEEEHKYGLVCSFSDQAEEAAMAKARAWLARDDLKAQWRTKRDRMLEDKIDLTAWMVDFVENYPRH